MTRQKLPLVIVEWLDANTESGWTAVKDIKHEPTPIRTVGWLLSQTDKCLVMFSSHTDDGDAGEVTTIPAPWIQTVKKLRGNTLTIKKE